MLHHPLLEFLEQAAGPAVTFVFNTSLDSSGFFTKNIECVERLERGRHDPGSQLAEHVASDQSLGWERLDGEL